MISLNDTANAPMIPDNQLALLADKIFAAQGWLETNLGLEHRSQQEAMAQAVIRSFVSNQPLLFEAGTGVGKSLAYLIPGIIVAVTHKRPFIVSSHTIALQEQIKNKDLEICRKLFASVPALQPYRDFKVAMLVGRGNYLCKHRLFKAIETKSDLFGGPEQDDLERIALWSNDTQTGLREELKPPPSAEVWEWVNADSSACNKKNCNHKTCFFRKALLARAQAQVIIVNHSLLFSLIGAGLSPGEKSNGILYPDDFVVLDEAHTVPTIAADHFGLGVSSYAVNRALKMLYNPIPSKPRGLLLKYGKRQDHTTVVKAIAAADEFFSDIRRRLLFNRDIVRLHQDNWADPILNQPLGQVIYRLQVIGQDMDRNEIKEELDDHIHRLQHYLQSINAALELKESDHVYWLETGGHRRQVVYLRSAPLAVAEYLQETIFNRQTAVLLTSATLATGKSMDTFKNDVGAWEQNHQIEASPFDYLKHCRIYLATDSPLPNSAQQGQLSLDYLADMIQFCSLRNPGGTLVLFTSYADMSKVAGMVEQPFAESGRSLLVQGRDYSRTDLKKMFVQAGNAVLFGTDSFWTGFDVPGPALSQVIITRLPFINPSHPLAEAKSEYIRKLGRNPFIELMLPDAVIKFRQGVGRLIRTKTDRGAITILDSRILTKEYGRNFIRSLPHQNLVKLDKISRKKVFNIT